MPHSSATVTHQPKCDSTVMKATKVIGPQSGATGSSSANQIRWSLLRAKKCLRRSEQQQCQIICQSVTQVAHLSNSGVASAFTSWLTPISNGSATRLGDSFCSQDKPKNQISVATSITTTATGAHHHRAFKAHSGKRAQKFSTQPSPNLILLPMYLLILLAISSLNQSNLIKSADATPSDSASQTSSTNETLSSVQQALMAPNSSDTFNPQSQIQGKDKPPTATSGNSNHILNNLSTSLSQRSSGPTSQSNLLNRTPLLKQTPFHRPGNFKSNHACEGSQMELSCQEGKLIHLVRANYGRFSLSICNDLGHSNYSVDCASFRAFLFMQNRCNKLTNCSVTVSKELFGDPCEGTSKYLEVQYYCSDASQAKPSGLPANAPALQRIGQTLAAPVAHKSPNSAPLPNQAGGVGGAQPPEPVEPSAGSGRPEQVGVAGPPQDTAPGGGQAQLQSQFQAQFQQHQPAAHFCQAQTSSRNLLWNATRPGQLARQACPEGATGLASWLCFEWAGAGPTGARFLPLPGPDFSRCRSNWLLRLAGQLDQLLEAGWAPGARRVAGAKLELLRQQDEQMVGSLLGELALMARTRELFADDLRQIEAMLAKMVAHLRRWSAPSGAAQPRDSGEPQLELEPELDQQQQQQWRPANLGPMWEKVFAQVASIVASLMEAGQRLAWLEMNQPEARQGLELRLLERLRDAGLLMAAHSQWPAPVRLANVFARLEPDLQRHASPDLVQQHHSSGDGPLALPIGDTGTPPWAQQQPGELLRLPASLATELAANGVGKILLIEVKKPDYVQMRHQLEQQAAGSLQTSASAGLHQGEPAQATPSTTSGADQAARLQTRIVGAFAVLADHSLATSLEGSRRQQDMAAKLNELTSQWPIEVEFNLMPAEPFEPLQLAGADPVANGLPARQCQSLADDNGNRCKLASFNETNFVCVCDRFGFVSLTNVATRYPLNTAAHQQADQLASWPDASLALGGGGGGGTGTGDDAQPNNGQLASLGQRPLDYGANLARHQQQLQQQLQQHHHQQQQQQQQTYGLTTSVLLACALGLLVVMAGAYVINAAIKASTTAHSGLGKKQQSFLESLSATRQPSTTATTTSSINDPHQNLMGNLDPLIGPNGAHCVSGTQSASSIIGLANGHHQNHLNHAPTGPLITGNSCAANNVAYKTHQQLYGGINNSPTIGYSTSSLAAHNLNNQSRSLVWPRLVDWLARTSRRLATTIARSPSTALEESRINKLNKTDHMLHHQHHQIIATATGQHSNSTISTTVGGLAAYKCHQNGYTTSLGLYHPHLAQQQQQLAQANHNQLHQQQQQMNSSSNSSYVSSSAYYEEIGPGNLTKMHSGQNHTIIDPFKRPQMAEQYQWTMGSNNNNNEQRNISVPTNFMSTGAPSVSQAMQTQRQANNQHNHHNNTVHHNDLSPLQSSSSSSAGSQHSAATSVTTANGSTPRHYLFVSPSSANGYKPQFRQ